MAEIKEWATVPTEDGREINVQFKSGNARARWNATTVQWEIRRSTGEWRPMNYDRGAEPITWWHDE